MKNGIYGTIASIIVLIVIALLSYSFKQSDTLTRHDVKIAHNTSAIVEQKKTQKAFREEVREERAKYRDNLEAINISLVQLAALLKNHNDNTTGK